MGGGGHNVPILFDDFGLRRLTENECLTLQGYQEREVIFPDKLNKQTKYSMIGNAIYPKVAEILMKRIDYSKVRGMADDKLDFPPNNDGTTSGFNDGAIDTFAGNRLSSVVREIIQIR